jgi:hypothetical protein
MAQTRPNSNPLQLINRLLDRGYTQATSQVINTINRNTNDGIVAQRLTELEREAARLQALGQKITPDNPIARALLADLEAQLNRNASLIDAAGGSVQSTGINAAGQVTRQLALPGFSDQQLASIGIRWNSPDPEAVNALINYATGSAWQSEIANYTPDVLQVVINGIISGQNPITTARDLRGIISGLPAARANNLMRTLQLQSYRDAAAINQTANRDILSEQIRIAALDARCCLCCISKHGERLPIGERITGHHQCRCTSIAVVKGRPISVRTGEQWFNSLPEWQRREIAGGANFAALEAGEVKLKDFVQPYTDKVFGDMIREASLKSILGEAAKTYYAESRAYVPTLQR